MDLSEISAGTPKVLGHCLELFQNSQPADLQVRSAPVTPAKYESHPDIQFFRLVKTKHHYAYHKLKQTSGDHRYNEIGLSHTAFDPYNRELLLERLKTYNALNWSVPSSRNSALTDLKCALHGWKCMSLPKNPYLKNQLRCSGCHSVLTLRFNSVEQQPQFAPFKFDLADIQELNHILIDQYISQIERTGHDLACSWTKVHTPDSVYYLTPYLSNTNATLISEFLERLRNLTDNVPILQDHVQSFEKLAPSVDSPELQDFVRVSNKWLLCRYFYDNKENFLLVLEKMCPIWVYWLAALGWNLQVQSFGSQTVILLVCGNCNQRVFMKENDSMELEDEQLGHKSWCTHAWNVDNSNFVNYFIKLVSNLETNIGPQGEYLTDQDLLLDMQPSQKRSSIDIEDGLEKLKKLRKLYFES